MTSCALQLSKQRHVRFAPYATAGDQAGALALVTFSVMVDTHDPASGQEVRVPVVFVRAPKMQFLGLRLEKVGKVACLRSLGAHVSNRPDELQAVKPIVELTWSKSGSSSRAMRASDFSACQELHGCAGSPERWIFLRDAVLRQC